MIKGGEIYEYWQAGDRHVSRVFTAVPVEDTTQHTFDFLLPTTLSVTEYLTSLSILDTQTEGTEVGDSPRLSITLHGTRSETDRVSPLNTKIATSMIAAFRIPGRRILVDGQRTMVPPTTMGVRGLRVEDDRSDRSVRRVGRNRLGPDQVGIFQIGFSVV
jgi:hypothetical protein